MILKIDIIIDRLNKSRYKGRFSQTIKNIIDIKEKFFNKEKINKIKINNITYNYNKSKIIPRKKLYNGGKK